MVSGEKLTLCTVASPPPQSGKQANAASLTSDFGVASTTQKPFRKIILVIAILIINFNLLKE